MEAGFQRDYTCQGELLVRAPDQATAQAALEAAQAAITAALQALPAGTAPVSFSVEKENGLFVLQI